MNHYIIFLSLFVVISFSSNIRDIKIFGHRGGIRILVPESSLLSFSIGAQMNVDYLECDIVSTKDGELIVMHDFILDHMTDIAEHDEFSDRKEYFNHTYREPNMISNIYNENRTSHGYHVWNFTLNEIKTLKLRARDPYFYNSPLNDQFEILTFREFLYLVNNLSVSLNRSIGVTPELKAAWIMREVGLEMEHKYMNILYETGFVEYINNEYYKTKYFIKQQSNVSFPTVIVQSDSLISLNIIGNLSNNIYSNNTKKENIPLQFGIYSKDEVDYKLLNWIGIFANGINIPWLSIDEYSKAINNENISFDRVHFRLEDFVPGYDDNQYSRQFVRNEYFKAFNYNFTDAVFTDNGENTLTMIDMIYEVNNESSILYSDDYNLIDKELFSSDGNNDDDTWRINGWFYLFILMTVFWIITVIFYAKKSNESNSGNSNRGYFSTKASQFTEIAHDEEE